MRGGSAYNIHLRRGGICRRAVEHHPDEGSPGIGDAYLYLAPGCFVSSRGKGLANRQVVAPCGIHRVASLWKKQNALLDLRLDRIVGRRSRCASPILARPVDTIVREPGALVI